MKQSRLGDHVNFLSGFAFKSSLFNQQKNGVPIIRIRDVVSGHSETYYSGEYDHRYIVEKGDYLIGMDGEFNLAKWKSGPALLNQRVCKIGEVSENLDRDYLARYLAILLKKIEAETPFVTVKHLSVKKLNESLIPLPALSEQKRIATILDAADALRAKRRESIEQLDKLAQSVFIDMFGDPVTNPKGWSVGVLGDVVSEKPSYGSGASAVDYDPTMPRYIRITDIESNGDLSVEAKSASVSATEEEKYKLLVGDVLLARSGATVGKSYLHKDQTLRSIYAGYLIRFRTDQSILLPEFLFRFTQTRAYWRWVSTQARAVAQPNINAQMYSAMPIFLPPISLQKAFIKVVERIDAQKDSARIHQLQMDPLFETLQSQAFSGNL